MHLVTPAMVEFGEAVQAKRQLLAFAGGRHFKGLAVGFNPFHCDAARRLRIP